MPEIDATVEFEAWCSTCGAGICGSFTARTGRGYGAASFDVEPCDTCLNNKYDEGLEDGRQEVEI